MPEPEPAPDDVLDLPNVEAWEAWLAQHHDTSPDGWLRIAKKHSALASLGIADALDGALCWGWIDGQRRALDEVSFLQRYCPRRARSSWSQVNVAKVERLTAAHPAAPEGPDARRPGPRARQADREAEPMTPFRLRVATGDRC